MDLPIKPYGSTSAPYTVTPVVDSTRATPVLGSKVPIFPRALKAG